MKICIGGRNNIAINVCKYLQTFIPKDLIFAIPGKNDDGKDFYQRSFLKYVCKEGIQLVTLQEVYDWDDLIFLSLEFDKIIRPHKFKTNNLFNIHFSLLPAYKGMYTSALQILHNEQYGGVTFHYMDAGIDTGDIIDQIKFAIPEDYKAIDLYLRCIEEGTQLVTKNIQNILRGEVKSYPQSSKGSSYYSMDEIKYSNLSINLNSTASQIDCQVRAYSYRPFQLSKILGYNIFYTKITEDKSSEKAGTLIEDKKEYIRIASIDYDIILYKDRLNEIIGFAKDNNLAELYKIKDIDKYLEEKEKQYGWTPLMVAAYHNSFDVVRFFVKHGANINNTNYNGTSVIMFAKDGALFYNDYRTLDYLLDNGADPSIQDNTDKNLFDYIDKDSSIWLHINKYKQ